MANRKTILGLFLINFAVTLGFGIADAFFSVYAQSLGARGMLLGVAVGCYACAKIILSPLMGKWADRTGQKTLLRACLLMYLVVSFGYLILVDPVALVALRLLQGVGFAVFRPVLLSLIGGLARSDRRAATTGTFDMSFYSALGIGPVLGGLLKDYFGYAGVYGALFWLCAIALMLAFTCVPNTATSVEAKPSRRHDRIIPTLLQDVKSRGTLAGLMAFIFGRACLISVFVTFLPILLITELELSGMMCGLVMASSTVVMTLTLQPMGRLADRMPRGRLVVAGGAGVSLLYFLIPFAVSFHEFLALGAGIGLLSALSQPASAALLIDQGKNYGAGLAAGSFHSALNMGLVTGPLVGAVIYNEVGIGAVFHCGGACGVLTVVLFSLCALHRRSEDREEVARGIDLRVTAS